MAQAEFKDFTETVLATVRRDTIEKLNQAGDLVRDSMKEECPVDSGDLKNSIRVRREPKELAVKILAGNKRVYYVHMVLYGTVHSRPNNFMQRALDKNLNEIKHIFESPITTTESKGGSAGVKKKREKTKPMTPSQLPPAKPGTLEYEFAQSGMTNWPEFLRSKR